jgi:hypothetical protein
MENEYERRSITPEYLVYGTGIAYVFVDGMETLTYKKKKKKKNLIYLENN